MLAAFLERDRSYDGLFYGGVTTTGVFCRPSCPARDPKPEHIEFYATTREALVAGFRPCKRCRPLDAEAGTPEWAARLIGRVEADPRARISDADLRAEGLDPAAVRRWFKKTHGMTFQAYCRARRLGDAFVALRSGDTIDEVVFEHGWESHSGFRTAFGKLAGAPPGAAGGGADGSLVRLAWLETPVGPLIAGATEEAVVLLEYPDRRMLEAQLDTVRRRFARPLAPGDSPLLDRLRAQLDEYFAGTGSVRPAAGVPRQPVPAPRVGRPRRSPTAEPQTRTYAGLGLAVGVPRQPAQRHRHARGNCIAIVIRAPPRHRRRRRAWWLRGWPVAQASCCSTTAAPSRGGPAA